MNLNTFFTFFNISPNYFDELIPVWPWLFMKESNCMTNFMNYIPNSTSVIFVSHDEILFSSDASHVWRASEEKKGIYIKKHARLYFACRYYFDILVFFRFYYIQYHSFYSMQLCSSLFYFNSILFPIPYSLFPVPYIFYSILPIPFHSVLLHSLVLLFIGIVFNFLLLTHCLARTEHSLSPFLLVWILNMSFLPSVLWRL